MLKTFEGGVLVEGKLLVSFLETHRELGLLINVLTYVYKMT